MDRSKKVASLLLATSLAGTAGANISTGIKLTNFLNGATTILTTAVKPFVAVAICSVCALGLAGHNLYSAAKWGINKIFNKKTEEPKGPSYKNMKKEAVPSKFSNFKDRIKKALENMGSVEVNIDQSSILLRHWRNSNNNFIKITKLQSETIEVILNNKSFNTKNVCDIETALNGFFKYSEIDLRVKPIEKEKPSLDDIKIVDKKDYDNIYHVKIGDFLEEPLKDKGNTRLTEEEKNKAEALIADAEKEIEDKTEKKKKVIEQKEFEEADDKEFEKTLEEALELGRKNEKKLFRGKAEKVLNGVKNFLVNTVPKAIVSFLRPSKKLNKVWEKFKERLKGALDDETFIKLYISEDSVSLNIDPFNFIEIKKMSSGTVNVEIAEEGMLRVMEDFCNIGKELDNFFMRHDIDFCVAPIKNANPSLDDIKIVKIGELLNEKLEKNSLELIKNDEDNISQNSTNDKESEEENNEAEINNAVKEEQIKEKEKHEKKPSKNINSSYEDEVHLIKKIPKDFVNNIFEKPLKETWQSWENFKKYLQNALVKDCCYVSSPWKDTITLGKGEVNLSITYLGENKFKVSSHYVPKGYEGTFDAKGVAKSLAKFFERGYSKYYRLDNLEEVNSLEDIKIIDVVKENEDAKLKDTFFGVTEDQWESLYKFLLKKFENSGTKVGILDNSIMLTKGYETALINRLDSGKIEITSKKGIFKFNTFSSFKEHLNSIFEIFGLKFRVENKEDLKKFVSKEVPAAEKVNNNDLQDDDGGEKIIEEIIDNNMEIDDIKIEETEENYGNEGTGYAILQSYDNDDEGELIEDDITEDDKIKTTGRKEEELEQEENYFISDSLDDGEDNDDE